MGLLRNLIISVLNLAFVATDILFLFVIVRMACYRWNIPWLRAIDSAGKGLLDWFAIFTRRIVSHFTNRYFSQKSLLIIGMTAIIFIRFFLVALFSK
jgi:hypothetical protein